MTSEFLNEQALWAQSGSYLRWLFYVYPLRYCSAINKEMHSVMVANKKSDGIRLKDTMPPRLS
jgi:hypothetical protein